MTVGRVNSMIACMEACTVRYCPNCATLTAHWRATPDIPRTWRCALLWPLVWLYDALMMPWQCELCGTYAGHAKAR